MAFTPYSGNFPTETIGWLGSSAIVKGGLVMWDFDSGYLEPAGVIAECYGVNMDATQTASATNGATKTTIIAFRGDQVWQVDTTGDLVQTQVGTIVSLTDAVSIDEDDTGNVPLFEIIGYTGALTDRKALVRPHMRLLVAFGHTT